MLRLRSPSIGGVRGNIVLILNSVVGRVALTRMPAQIEDVRTGPGYLQGDPVSVAGADLGGYRTVLSVPMLKDEELVGTITIYRQEVRLFTDKQIELLQSFAAQAVIAIENTRLLNELRQRTDDLTESLEQQTATSEVLQVINSSPGALTPVFDAMLEKAMHLCEAAFGGLWMLEEDRYVAVALRGVPQPYAAFLGETTLIPGPGTAPYRLLHGERLVHNVDLASEKAYLEGDPQRRALVDLGGARSALQVALRKEDAVLGVITIYRQEVRPFTDKQIELVTNFAAQAVIAIENTRLLNELRKSLEQQTATSEILRVISTSPTSVEPVFETIVRNAVALCGGLFANVFRYDGALLHYVASHQVVSGYVEMMRTLYPRRPDTSQVSGRVILSGSIVRMEDALADPVYDQRFPAAMGWRRMLGVPMLRDGVTLGVIVVGWAEAGPVPKAQEDLLKTFADQAAIAIENVRLFDEVQKRTEDLSESLQQQTATADVLKVISRSTFDLQTVLDTLTASAARLCDADKAFIFRREGAGYRLAANFGFSPDFKEYMERYLIEPGRGSLVGRTTLERRVVHIPDVFANSEYAWREAVERGGIRTMLGIPLMREGVPIGVFQMTRSTVQPFTDKQIELVKSFADQAVIAIENVRLFDEIQDKSRQLAEASQHKSQFLANMSHELRTPLNAILGYTELIADGIYGAPPEKMGAVLKRVESNGRHLLGLINAVLDLSKIEAGQFTLDLADYSLQNVAQTVYNAVKSLAVDKKLVFKTEVQSDLPQGHGDERRLTQVLLNLVGNAIKFTDAGEVVIKAAASNGTFNLAVRDTGPGISAADQAKLFQEFQQADNSMTRKKEGTGLGLAISKRIIEMHGGRIWIKSQIGQGSTFFVVLPVQAQEQTKPPSK